MKSALPSPDLLSYDEAAALVGDCARSLTKCHRVVEAVELDRAVGRVLAQPLKADLDQPPFARSTRDGFACRAVEACTHAFLAIAGTTRAGLAPAGPLPAGAVWEIMTGAPVPAGADAVVMLEHVETQAGKVRLLPPRKIEPGENIVARGAQARAGDELLAAGTTIHSGQLALAAACGCETLPVFARPRVAILTTGDELVPVSTIPAPGQIRNSNGPMLAAMVAAAGGEPWVLPTAADNAHALDAALAEAADADLLLITGGVSAGKFDLVEPALARAGARFHFTGIRIQPGKPLVFGELPAKGVGAVQKENGTKCFFGLPGNPVSSAVTFLLFAAPVLAALAGKRETAPRFALARMAPHAERHGKPGLTRFLPGNCDFGASGDELPEVAFVPWHGSGDLGALARSNCFLVVPEKAHDLEPGEIVRILLP
jgi:molybdopterin molybdotransferase